MSPVFRFNHETALPEAVTKVSCAYGTPAAQPVVCSFMQQSFPQQSLPDNSWDKAVIFVFPIV
jgi:hypothetical protein